MTFGVFDVDDVEPLDVFNVLADSAHQKNWDSLLAGEKELGAVDQEMARGVEQLFDAHPFQNREIFEWQCFNASRDYKDLWVAFSSEQNQALAKRRRGAGEEAEPIVPAAELFDEDATVSGACAGAATGLAGLVQEAELVRLQEPASGPRPGLRS